ncbi:glycosyltransferase family 4 protein [Actinomyces faecalis]|uniref:glycosyltransferase family 4 protein n=1 Tax=Actinomyces faecalis TaxID=2722820 RepID=UPI0015580865|nr:glycosyltransferase family 4 protein [Actinomyces faecalis]
MKRINPRARVVGTFHDVMSQLFARKADQATKVERLRWASRNIITSVRERHVLDRLDRVVTLNEKDAELLEELGASGVTVLNPPLLATHFERRPQPTRVVVVGYYAREVNVQGVSWMVRKVWPIVRQHVPHAELLLVGSDPHEALGAFKSVPGVRAVGFVEDLDEIYESAAVVAVPLLMGSGVKFKTIEAVVRGIPVVSTSIGAEGVPDLAPEWICDDATGFASRILDIMRDPTSADNRARRGASAAQSRYGWDRFIDEVHTIYAR